MLQVKTPLLIEHRCHARWRQDPVPSRFPDPVHATYRYICNYTILGVVLLPLFFPACKFLQPPVQVLMGFLTRPVGGNYAHDHTRHSEDQHYEDCGLHIMSVPCIRPSMRLIAIADANMPNMIQNRSIISTPILLWALLSHSRR